jgi:hypothetical protein
VHCDDQHAGYVLVSSKSTVFVVRCHTPDACLGGAESGCAEGYDGNRCGQCADEWYMYSRKCMPCGSDAIAYTLVGVAICSAVTLSCFVLWLLMLDPRIASPFVFLLRLLETLAILQQTSIDWTPAVRSVFAALSVVNFNTQMFRLECLFGRPEPIQQAIGAACVPFATFLVFVAARPIIQLMARRRAKKHPARSPRSNVSLTTVTSMCRRLHPDAPPKERSGPLGFRPTDALAAASWTEYLRMVSAVPVPASAIATFPHRISMCTP